MKRYNVGILIFEEVEVLDFAGPYEVFSRTRLEPGAASRRSDASAPFHVFTVAKSAGTLATTGGLRVVPDYSFADAPGIDILVVPGGFGHPVASGGRRGRRLDQEQRQRRRVGGLGLYWRAATGTGRAAPLVGQHMLPKRFWLTEYGLPLEERFRAYRETHGDATESPKLAEHASVAAAIKSDPDRTDSGFYLLRKPA